MEVAAENRPASNDLNADPRPRLVAFEQGSSGRVQASIMELLGEYRTTRKSLVVFNLRYPFHQ